MMNTKVYHKCDIGDFCLINYLAFDGEIKVGIFYVIYHEMYEVENSKNFSAFKVSSNPSGYAVPISRKQLKFLAHDSYMNCSSSHRFNESQIIRVIGRSTNLYLNDVIKQTRKYYQAIETQLNNKLCDCYYVKPKFHK